MDLWIGSGLVLLLFVLAGYTAWRLRGDDPPPPAQALPVKSGVVAKKVPPSSPPPAELMPTVRERILYEEHFSQLAEKTVEEETSVPPRILAKPVAPAVKPVEELVRPSRDGVARVAVIIDDLGYHREESLAVARLGADITLAILPQGPYSREVAEAGKRAGKEVILHQPMEAQGGGIDLGPGGVVSAMGPERIESVVAANLAQFPEAVGLNNHMGSRLTEMPQAMAAVMRVLARKGFFFVDSRTSGRTVAFDQAVAGSVPRAKRDVFIDNIQERGAVLAQLRELMVLARKRGEAVAIGHPYPATVAALREWLGGVAGQGIRVVRVSQMLGPVSARARFPMALAMKGND